jgi:peptidoglycan/LPS O-acetylase OafA/YrhL
MLALADDESTSLRSRNRAYVPALSYLRAIAALTVVFYHGVITHYGYVQPGWHLEDWPLSWNPLKIYVVEGHTAVALFMVLSGYVLTLGVLESEIDYGKFIVNRMLRIYPRYGLLLVLAIYANPEGFSVAAFTQTLLPFANLPGIINAGVITAMFWAVAVEFQFYLVFPFLVRFLKKYGQSYLATVLVLALAVRLLTAFGPTNMHDFAYRTIFGRIDQFVIGMLAASLYVGRSYRRHWVLPAVAVAGLALLVAYNRAGGYPVDAWWKTLWPPVEGAAWAAIIVAAVHTPLRMPRLIGRPLIIVADMSCSIYLLHSTVFQIVGERHLYLEPFHSMFHNGLATGIVLLPIILALSYLTYFVVERPFMGLRRRYTTSNDDGNHRRIEQLS